MATDNALTCDFSGPQFLLFNEGIPNLVYYSHIPIFIIAFALGIYILTQGQNELRNRIFSFTIWTFGLWVFLDSIYWAAHRADVIMFVWTIIVLIEPLVHVGMLYLVYSLSNRVSITFYEKVAAALLFLPQIFFVPSVFTLKEFNLVECLPVESTFAFYSYTIETIIIVWITIIALKNYRRMRFAKKKKEYATVMIGVILFLISFTGGNVYGSLTGDWNFGAMGLFGMIIFAFIIAYSIVQFKTFHAKLFGAQALVFALVMLTGAQVFFVETFANWVLTSIAFALSLSFGFLLTRSVKSDINRKEELQEITDKLARANDELRKLDTAKSEFISIASHQLRTPLTAIKGYISLILEGSYGEAPQKINGALRKVYLANERLIQLVEDLLNISRIESGRLEYKFEKGDILALVEELKDSFILRAQEKGFTFEFDVPRSVAPVEMDYPKIREVVSNLIDNAIKYTKKGGVTVSVKTHGEFVRVMVIDTGIGIPRDVLPQLFSKFARGDDTERLHADGTGLGLYVGKNLVEAHNGRILVESRGAGKGSTFTIEIPFKQPRQM